MQTNGQHTSPGLVLAPAGPGQVVCASAAQVLIWSVETQQVMQHLRADNALEGRCSVGATSDGHIIAAGLVGKHPAVLIWRQSAPDMPAAQLKAHRFNVTSLAFDAQGETHANLQHLSNQACL